MHFFPLFFKERRGMSGAAFRCHQNLWNPHRMWLHRTRRVTTASRKRSAASEFCFVWRENDKKKKKRKKLEKDVAADPIVALHHQRGPAVRLVCHPGSALCSVIRPSPNSASTPPRSRICFWWINTMSSCKHILLLLCISKPGAMHLLSPLACEGLPAHLWFVAVLFSFGLSPASGGNDWLNFERVTSNVGLRESGPLQRRY